VESPGPENDSSFHPHGARETKKRFVEGGLIVDDIVAVKIQKVSYFFLFCAIKNNCE
jgi:hypothetical protein